MKLRLDKYLADMGIGTRTEVKKAITKGQVRVNEETVKRPEIKIDTEKDHVFYQGQMVAYAEYEYYMLNKPAGVVSATEDKNDSTVLDLIDEKQRKDLFPVGRLDKDTEGLLLITNDGELAHQLLSPKKHVDKVYFARIDGKVTEEDVRRFAEGLEIGEEKPTLPAYLEILKSEEISEIRLTIREGKFHQVKRMFHAVGKEVIYLKRLQMGSLVLDPRLALGEYRELTGQELEAEAQAAYDRVSNFIERAGVALGGQPSREEVTAVSADDLPTDFVAAMNDDVNVSGATAAIFTAIRSGNTLLSQLADRADSETAKAEVREALLAVRAMLDTLGLDPLAEPWVSAGAAGGAADGTAESPEHAALEALIAEQLNARAEARKAKDFAKADQIRDALTEAGIAIEDGPQGSTWSLK